MRYKTCIKNNYINVGVLAGTHYDVMLGMNLLESNNIPAIGFAISETPQEQTLLQLNRNKLMSKVSYAIGCLKKEKITCAFIYCNSLSGLLDIPTLEEIFGLPIITPLSAYKKIANKFNCFALIAANCQSIANIERILLTNNPTSTVIGLGNLNIVNSIEVGMQPKHIIDYYGLAQQCVIFEAQGCECLLLGCTHFTYFYKELTKTLKLFGCKLKIINPAETMLAQVLKLACAEPAVINDNNSVNYTC